VIYTAIASPVFPRFFYRAVLARHADEPVLAGLDVAIADWLTRKERLGARD